MFNRIERNVDRNVAYYVPCNFPFINERLISEGYNSRVSLLIGTTLISLPCYSKTNSGFPDSPKSDSLRLGYKLANDYLDIEISNKEFESFEEGIEKIANSIKQQKIMAVC
ncbi:hypothetical protein D3C74_141760 [compost metagenome]